MDKKTKKHVIGALTAVVCIALIIVLIFVVLGRGKTESIADVVKNASVGDIVKFGHYEQDDDDSNGKEDIEWIVLNKEDNRVLLISKYGLDCQSYNKTDDMVSWETCSLRGWLNSSFVNAAFEAEEQAFIADSIVPADKNPKYTDVNPGNDTIDKVFLLSIDEANKYFSSNDERLCSPTKYSTAQGSSGLDYCVWILRTPGHFENQFAGVDSDGSIYESGGRVDLNYGSVVRPALWINIEP